MKAIYFFVAIILFACNQAPQQTVGSEDEKVKAVQVKNTEALEIGDSIPVVYKSESEWVIWGQVMHHAKIDNAPDSDYYISLPIDCRKENTDPSTRRKPNQAINSLISQL